jgi:phosphohistidine phosphatase
VDLFLLRHGRADEAGHGTTDAGRKLTKKGREEIEAVADWMSAQQLHFDLIAASPLVRAQETAAIVADILDSPETLETWKVLLPGGNPDTVCREICKHPEETMILLVGHEPLLSSLIGRIITGGGDAGIAMTKGALAKIRDISCTERPSGNLHWLLTAKQMTGKSH